MVLQQHRRGDGPVNYPACVVSRVRDLLRHPIGTHGHTGRYSFVEDYAFVLDGEIGYCHEGKVEREVYVTGDEIHLLKGEAKSYRMVDHAWIVEYARGPIPMILPFGLADTLFSTLDFTILFRTFRTYAKHVLANLR